MKRLLLSVVCLLGWLGAQTLAGVMTDADPLYLPAVGDYQLRLISPTTLELTLITTKAPAPAAVTQWNFVPTETTTALPDTNQFAVSVNGQTITVQSVGFRRRVTYAPLKTRDLRIGNYLYLQLAGPVPADATVEVKNPDGKLWSGGVNYAAKAEPLRFSPVIHVDQVGYAPELPKKAMVGYYLGSLGELKIAATNFSLIDVRNGKTAFEGRLRPRLDVGYTYVPMPYQKVLEADFTGFKTPGEYRLIVPGLGGSYPFFINDGIPAAFTRAYALGLYDQRCGCANVLPYTRFVHDPCHTAPAKVPTMASPENDFVNKILREGTTDVEKNPRHTAPRLIDVAASLYPFENPGPVDVSGGHHDAGDYSKYTTSSALLIHYLVFAADNFPGAGDLDNLGLPESGDGKSDLLQEAKWEADFLAKMQDDDGGFYLLVYPQNRSYESNVLPDKGDPQQVFPKTTAATAAAVAALAQAASSPLFKKQFPEATTKYMLAAEKGWIFLLRATEKNGKDGSFQKMEHSGDTFMHDDWLAWAAAEMFVATGNEMCHAKLKAWFNPADPKTHRWGWWRMFGGYGCATRSYTFSARSGRLATNQLDPEYLRKCQAEIRAAGMDQVHNSEDNAYGLSFPSASKSFRAAGWFFAGEQAFDLATAYQLDYPVLNDSRPRMLAAMVANLNYEGGCNPVNVTYVTGLGWKRQREIVHQYAQNDRRVLPPSGIPLGAVEEGFYWMPNYKSELGALSFPADGAHTAPYPFYDRWGDSFNVATEFISATSARTLASYSMLMALSPLKNQPWKSATAEITPLTAAAGHVNTGLQVTGLDTGNARVVWEARDQEPAYGQTFSFTPKQTGEQWVEVEAQWPDGRRVVGVTNITATATRP